MSPRSVRAGAIATAALALLYVTVVAGASGSWRHPADQATADWFYLVPILGGFGVQVALVSEFRRRHRLRGAAVLSMDPAAGARLDVGGTPWEVGGWTGDGPGGHHREGELAFRAAGPAEGTATLVLSGFPGPVEATWSLG